VPCPHSGDGPPRRPEGRSVDEETLTRRRLVRAAVALGGASGLAACLDVERDDGGDGTAAANAQSAPRGPDDLSALPERQHAWTEFLVRDRFGNTVLPQHHAMFMLNYTGSVPPTEGERAAVENGLRTVERAFQRGTGGDTSAVEHNGVLFALGYSPSYFGRFDDSLHGSVDLPPPEAVLDALDESEPTADHYDAVLHLCSDAGSIVLAVERALTGSIDTLNGIPVEGGFADVFKVVERRTGFIGRGERAQRYEQDDIPESAPLSMGFKSGFVDNLPSEDRVTLREGPFAGGTTMQVSRLEHDLDSWYDHDHAERTRRMFSPDHTSEEVGEVGNDLAAGSGISPDTVDRAAEHANERGVLGHGQKVAEARDENFSQRLLRRDFDMPNRPGMHFDSWQRGIEDFIDVRRAMNGEHIDAEVDREDDGILGFIDVTNRATFLMPPRSKRALPAPDAR